MRRLITQSGLWLLLALTASGCISGREPPQVTSMITVPGGGFTLGSSDLKCGALTAEAMARCDTNPTPQDPVGWIDALTWVPRAEVVALPGFQLDEHEVTNEQYAYCVELGPCTAPAQAHVLGHAYYEELEYADRPVVNVSRQQARDYCRLLNKDLPTEAQWERAARHGAPGEQPRTFPWRGETASNCIKGSTTYAVALGCSDLPLPVTYSSADRTALGLRNMASNVAEWVRDGWRRYARCKGGQGYTEVCQKQGATCDQCVKDGVGCARGCGGEPAICKAGTYAGPGAVAEGAVGVVRGGSFRHGVCDQRLFVRRKGTGPDPAVGFRCSR